MFSVFSGYRDRPCAGIGRPTFPWWGKAGKHADFVPCEHENIVMIVIENVLLFLLVKITFVNVIFLEYENYRIIILH